MFRYCGEYFDKETGTIYLRARYYDPTVGRFLSEDPIGSGLNWYTYCGNSPVAFFDPYGLEQIVVSGSEYDEDRYKYNFIETAIKELKRLKDNGEDDLITWLISSAGYSDKDVINFKQTARDLGVNIIFFSDSNYLISYLNTKGINIDARKNDKITDFTVFSHGLEDGVLGLGYRQKNEKNIDISIDDICEIYLTSFDNPNCMFYSCRTGTSFNGKDSFAQQWVNRVGGTTKAYVGRTSYYDISEPSKFVMGANWFFTKALVKKARAATGYMQDGSLNYPTGSASEGAYLKTFRSKY